MSFPPRVDTQARRAAASASALNGIDFLEVVDSGIAGDPTRQLTLEVFLLTAAAGLDARHVRILGGERITAIAVLDAGRDLADPNKLVVTLGNYGDHSPYELRLVDPARDDAPATNFDPALASIVFSFKVNCDEEFDCVAPPVRTVPPPVETEIDYLARDYDSLRRVLLDRLATQVPGGPDRHPADQTVAVLELLAHWGDLFGYEQDAVATEAYLDTARRRVSARRHAVLVDATLDDGASARAWVVLEATATATVSPPLQFLPRRPGLATALTALPTGAEACVFEMIASEETPALRLNPAHNAIRIHHWSDAGYKLDAGTTRAWLVSDPADPPTLQPGDHLLLEAERDGVTGDEADADRTRRWVVRLTEVAGTTDPVTSTPLLEVRWAATDALPFTLCVARSRADGTVVADLAVARGNVLLADHGCTRPAAALPEVPRDRVLREPGGACGAGHDVLVPARYRPMAPAGPLAQIAPWTPGPAADARRTPFHGAVPAIRLHDADGNPWTTVPTLLDGPHDGRAFVVETESDGVATLRFGDDRRGRRPRPGTTFTAVCRTGTGLAGNIGAETLAHVVSPVAVPVARVRNPLPAWGGRDGESIEALRQRAPYAFRRQERAVTRADYAAIAERDPDLQRAAATFRWTGSWHTVFVTADRRDGARVDDEFRRATAARLEPFRMAGQDLEFDAPRLVALEFGLHVCCRPGYFRAHVRRALLDVFTSGRRPDGRLGEFHPDRFTFGQPVLLSRWIAAAQTVPGVASATATLFRRHRWPETSGLEDGELRFHPLEIAQLENSRNFPERGVFTLDVGGGL